MKLFPYFDDSFIERTTLWSTHEQIHFPNVGVLPLFLCVCVCVCVCIISENNFNVASGGRLGAIRRGGGPHRRLPVAGRQRARRILRLRRELHP